MSVTIKSSLDIHIMIAVVVVVWWWWWWNPQPVNSGLRLLAGVRSGTPRLRRRTQLTETAIEKFAKFASEETENLLTM